MLIGCGRRGAYRTVPSVKGATVDVHHASLIKCCGRVQWCTVSYLDSSVIPPCSIRIFLYRNTPTIFLLLYAFIFFHLHNFNFFLSKHKILKIKEFQLNYLKFLKFKISHTFKFSYPEFQSTFLLLYRLI